MRAHLELENATVAAPGGRPLFEALNLRLGPDRVALVGRNGVGKSTLLALLAATDDERVVARSAPRLVPQALEPAGLSHGERRREALHAALESGTEILLLDEPTEDLDEDGIAWLRRRLTAWEGCLVVASHDRRLLRDFRHFFVASESGCRYFGGTLDELDAELERERLEGERRYARNLTRLAAHEEHAAHVARRKARKKRYGRCRELDRATPRIRLNRKRDLAQDGHGRARNVREARLDAIREWSRSTRRVLNVDLTLELPVPTLPEPTGDAIVLRGATAAAGERALFHLDLRVRRERLAVVGPNGAGKSTLLALLLGRRRPREGSASRDLTKIGSIEQGSSNWMLEDSLLDRLAAEGSPRSLEDLAGVVAAHKFPLALARRPMRSLSPGERARAALVCLFRRSPAVEVLVLDEPSHGLDLVGQRAMIEALRAWPGGLVVASHDRDFLTAIGVDTFIRLGP